MKKTLDTNEKQIGQDQSFNVPNTGSINRDDFRDNFEIMDTPNWDKIRTLKFMEEMVEIEISETDKENAEQTIQLSNNGINQFLFRGVPQYIRRKFVEILARARPVSISTPEFTDATGGRATKIVKTQGLKYPFRVLTDTPEGHRWCESVLKEPN